MTAATTRPMAARVGKGVSLMPGRLSMIKRPVRDPGDRPLVGFRPDPYAGALTWPLIATS
ncbi:MAG: hypothetical protein Q8S03_11180 [Brevundimonas sp.]|uniref:hypothetical protein n=1 Tax=Brevundimonas sp. TaxID=1871086 RepID=UPI00273242B2|nr:hypothetical protein [Brevundimonas sp.]MDP3405245.1 hypothetical protein [Brevundimonas sp.]